MRKKVAIVQSCYIPWKGYFDLINMVDEFVLYDHVQFTRRDWRNRNLIKTANGLLWLTIPVEVKGRYFQRICDTRIVDKTWQRRHWKTICQNYVRAPFFREYRELFEEVYKGAVQPLLSEVNHRFLVAVCGVLRIMTSLSWSSGYRVVYEEGESGADGKTRRLIEVCRQAGAGEYISGPAAKAYLNERLFEEANIALSYIDYSGYPEYRQLFPPFEHGVSILDLIFNEGEGAREYMKSFSVGKVVSGGSPSVG